MYSYAGGALYEVTDALGDYDGRSYNSDYDLVQYESRRGYYWMTVWAMC